MPSYVYYCSNCNQEFDVEFEIGTAPDTIECPICRAILKRLFTATPRIWKEGAPS